MPQAIEALRRCFAAHPNHIARSSFDAAGGDLLVMPAVDQSAAGIKLLMVQPVNTARGVPVIQGMYVLFDAERGCPVAILDGAALTRLRTPAASAIATDALARPDAETLGIIGSGPQAVGHIESMLCVRSQISRIVIGNRSEDNAHRVLHQVSTDHHLMTGADGTVRRISVGSISEAAGCDIVCVATRSDQPLVHATMVRPGTHLNAVGAYRSDMRELSAELLAAGTVVVDEVTAARDEAGDLIAAVAEQRWSWDQVAGDLADVADGTLRRRFDSEITVFKSVGLAIEDLVIAQLAAAAEGLI